MWGKCIEYVNKRMIGISFFQHESQWRPIQNGKSQKERHRQDTPTPQHQVAPQQRLSKQTNFNC